MLSACGTSQKKSSQPNDWHWDDNTRGWQWLHSASRAEPQVAEEGWVFEKSALSVHVESDQSLNAYGDESHTVLIKVLQLSDPGAFNQLTKTASGLRHLLVGEKRDSSVIFSDSFTVEPRVVRHLSFDRQEGTRYIGVVVGFVDLDGASASRVVDIVGMDDNPPKKGWFGRTWAKIAGGGDEPLEALPIRPANLSLSLRLGSNGINNAVIQAR